MIFTVGAVKNDFGNYSLQEPLAFFVRPLWRCPQLSNIPSALDEGADVRGRHRQRGNRLARQLGLDFTVTPRCGVVLGHQICTGVLEFGWQLEQKLTRPLNILFRIQESAVVGTLQGRALELTPLDHPTGGLVVDRGDCLKNLLDEGLIEEARGECDSVSWATPAILPQARVFRRPCDSITSPIVGPHQATAAAAPKQAWKQRMALPDQGAKARPPQREHLVDPLPHVTGYIGFVVVVCHNPFFRRPKLHHHTSPTRALFRLPTQEHVVSEIGGVAQHAVQQRGVDRAPSDLPSGTPWELESVFTEVGDDLPE